MLGSPVTCYSIIHFARDEESRTPAHLAAMMNQSTTLQRLVDCGADIDVPDAHGRHTVMQSNTQSHYMHLHTQSHTSYTVTVAAWW